MPTSACERLENALAKIAATEDDVRAWVYRDEGAARDVVAKFASERVSHDAAPLAGEILGVKDIFDVAGMPTRCGIAGDDLSRGPDATSVARLRAAGAVVLGKTHTTPFAWLDPAQTRNPHDLARTPGGSSAGSAAAVAAGHCTIALGSQTVASTLRPASFCGVVGFKPTFDRIPTGGITPLAPSLDHVGIFARDVATVRRVAAVFELASHDDAARPHPTGAPRFLLDDLAGDATASLATRAALARAADALRRTGHEVETIRLPPAVARASESITTVLAYESYAMHGDRWRALAGALPPRLRELLALGEATRRDAYEAALAERASLRQTIDAFLGSRVLLALCVPDEAPDRATTGDGRYVRPWTFFGVPAIAIPAALGPSGLPIAVQLVAASDRDADLLTAATVLETALG